MTKAGSSRGDAAADGRVLLTAQGGAAGGQGGAAGGHGGAAGGHGGAACPFPGPSGASAGDPGWPGQRRTGIGPVASGSARLGQFPGRHRPARRPDGGTAERPVSWGASHGGTERPAARGRPVPEGGAVRPASQGAGLADSGDAVVGHGGTSGRYPGIPRLPRRHVPGQRPGTAHPGSPSRYHASPAGLRPAAPSPRGAVAAAAVARRAVARAAVARGAVPGGAVARAARQPARPAASRLVR